MSLSRYYQTCTVTGTVVSVDLNKLCFSVQARSGDIFETFVGLETYYQVLTNLDGLQRDRVPNPAGFERNENNRVAFDLQKYIKPEMPVVVEGVAYMNGNQQRYEARTVNLLHSDPRGYLFEETHWWLVQISQMADRWLDNLFDARRSYQIDDFSKLYRTNLNITGQPTDDTIQECDTLSRVIYGLSSAYLLTGAERYYLAAKAAVAYQREAFRSLSHDGEYCFWAFGRRRRKVGDREVEQLIIPSENADDLGAIPLYEQIYALCGLAQYYRITLDWEVLEDIRRTVNAFQDYFWDPTDEALRQTGRTRTEGFAGAGGYYSHLDYATMRPDSSGLGQNQSRKNWNSIGDHIPAYLINLILALDPLPQGSGRSLDKFLTLCRGILEETSRLIVEKFPDPQSDYVNERFHADWTPDHTHGWQQNFAIVGHNLKISWNLTRCAFYFQGLEEDHRDHRNTQEADRYKERAEQCLALARRLARRMADVGLDKIRGGIFDQVAREPQNGMPTEFGWSTNKDFWQQEQGILAYLILHGADPKESEFLALARESTAFWNLYFLDRDRQGIFFRTTQDGLPFIQGTYGQKESHSTGYHAYELNYLAHFYTRSYVSPANGHDNNFCVYFKIAPDRDQESINVLPDFAPPGLLEITCVRKDGVECTKDLQQSDLDNFQIHVPRSDQDIELAVEFRAKSA